MVDSKDIKKVRTPDGPTCDRALLCPEDWVEPEGRKVLGEFHKEGLPEGLPGVDADLERFEEYWSSKGSVNMQGVYHKEGAPYLEKIDDKGEPGHQTKIGSDTSDAIPETERQRQPRDMPEPQSDRTIDLATVEIVSYALFRAVFGTGVRIPLKREGVVDAEITIRNKDIILNTNEFYTNIPDLAVWRVIYTHQGSPIFEFGRGVPKGLKVHRWNTMKLGFSLWRETRARRKVKERLEKEGEPAISEKIKKVGEAEEKR